MDKVILPEKLCQLAAFPLKRSKAQTMPILDLLAMLWAAEIASIEETAHSMAVHPRMFELNSGDWGQWQSLLDKYFKIEGDQIRLIADPGDGLLCDYEAEKLMMIFYGQRAP